MSEDKKKNILDIRDLVEELVFEAHERGYARAALRMPFPPTAAVEAYAISRKRVQELQEEISEIISSEVSGQLREAQQSTANMLKACLSGIQIGKEEKDGS